GGAEDGGGESDGALEQGGGGEMAPVWPPRVRGWRGGRPDRWHGDRWHGGRWHGPAVEHNPEPDRRGCGVLANDKVAGASGAPPGDAARAVAGDVLAQAEELIAHAGGAFATGAVWRAGGDPFHNPRAERQVRG